MYTCTRTLCVVVVFLNFHLQTKKRSKIIIIIWYLVVSPFFSLLLFNSGVYFIFGVEKSIFIYKEDFFLCICIQSFVSYAVATKYNTQNMFKNFRKRDINIIKIVNRKRIDRNNFWQPRFFRVQHVQCNF